MVQRDGAGSNRANVGLDHRAITAGRKERETESESERARSIDVGTGVVCVHVEKSCVHARAQSVHATHAQVAKFARACEKITTYELFKVLL